MTFDERQQLKQAVSVARLERVARELKRDKWPPPTSAEISEAYWRGVHDGRKLDRRRVYELGYRRGLREAQALADAIFGEPADRVNPSKPKGEWRR